MLYKHCQTNSIIIIFMAKGSHLERKEHLKLQQELHLVVKKRLVIHINFIRKLLCYIDCITTPDIIKREIIVLTREGANWCDSVEVVNRMCL